MSYMCRCNTKSYHCRYLSGLFKVITETLKKVSYLENFPAYIRNTATDNCNELLNELNLRNSYPQGKPPYSASMIRYALYLRFTSLQTYRLLLGKFPMSSL